MRSVVQGRFSVYVVDNRYESLEVFTCLFSTSRLE